MISTGRDQIKKKGPQASKRKVPEEFIRQKIAVKLIKSQLREARTSKEEIKQ